ncbi:MAG: hypothetical protein JWO56_2376 [Acidobacteria bacterium]|nr:hypothetical protein [Acidobacteriota bacterium]
MLIKGMTEQEIRVLQEYRRVAADTLGLAAIKAIKHPVGGGEAPARSLVGKGYLAPSGDADGLTLTELAREFLSYDPKPEYEESGPSEVVEVDV